MVDNKISDIPKVTVIIPSYNHSEFVESAIRSVWGQTYDNVELIVIDDGSSDNSKAIIEDLESISPIPMYSVFKENEGICKTLNLGLSLSNGDYLCFLASDDVYPQARVEMHVGFLEANPTIGACCGYLMRIDRFGNRIHGLKSTPRISKDQFRDTIMRRSGLSLQGATFRSEIFLEHKFDPDLYFEDWDFYIRVTRDYRVEPINVHSCDYRVLETGANRNVDKMISAREDILKKYRSCPYLSPSDVRVLRAEIYVANSKSNYNVGRYRESFRWLAPLVFVSPMLIFKNIEYILSLIKRSVFH